MGSPDSIGQGSVVDAATMLNPYLRAFVMAVTVLIALASTSFAGFRIFITLSNDIADQLGSRE